MSEETIIDTTARVSEPSKEKIIVDTNPNSVNNSKSGSAPSAPTPPKNKKKDKSDMKKTIGTATLAGAVGMVAGILTPVQIFPQEQDELSEEELNELIDETDSEANEIPEAATTAYVAHDLDIATGVDDSMTFSQAFAAARHEVGAGGIFVWHGHTYGTYYADEWNSMSEDEKEEYWQNVYHTTSLLNENNHNETEQGDTAMDDELPTEPVDGWDDADEDNADAVLPEEIIEDEIVIDADNHEEGVIDAGSIAMDDDSSDILIANEDSSDILLDAEDSDCVEEMPDVDLLASNTLDEDLDIDNDMDMSDFV